MRLEDKQLIWMKIESGKIFLVNHGQSDISFPEIANDMYFGAKFGNKFGNMWDASRFHKRTGTLKKS